MAITLASSGGGVDRGANFASQTSWLIFAVVLVTLTNLTKLLVCSTAKWPPRTIMSCGCMSLPCFICLVLVGIGFVFLWSLLLDEDYHRLYARCDNCHCVTTSERCPVEQTPFHDYSTDTTNLLAFQKPLNPFNLTCNPFNTSPCRTTPMQSWIEEGETAVCAIKYEYNNDNRNSCPSTYTLKTYRSIQTAYFDDVSTITHTGACGACSETRDLAALIRHPDMVTTSKECIKKGGIRDSHACFKNLGFSESCAFLWNEYARATMRDCFKECLWSDLGDKDFNDPDDCSLNKCLKCQKEKTEAIFERVAGRTHARSGLLSSIVKSCDSIPMMEHDACPTALS